MKKSLTILTLVTLFSFSAKAQDTALSKEQPSVKQAQKHKITNLKKAKKKQRILKKIADADEKSEKNKKETMRLAETNGSGSGYGDTNEPTTLNSAPKKPVSHTIKNF